MVYQEGKHSEVTGLIKSVADSGLELQAVRAKSFCNPINISCEY